MGLTRSSIVAERLRASEMLPGLNLISHDIGLPYELHISTSFFDSSPQAAALSVSHSDPVTCYLSLQ